MNSQYALQRKDGKGQSPHSSFQHSFSLAASPFPAFIPLHPWPFSHLSGVNKWNSATQCSSALMTFSGFTHDEPLSLITHTH